MHGVLAAIALFVKEKNKNVSMTHHSYFLWLVILLDTENGQTYTSIF